MNWALSVVALELRKIFAYRSDFWIGFLGQVFIQLIVAAALWTSIFNSQNTDEMNGFSLNTMILYYLIAPIGMKILMGENIGFLSREIYQGTFTRYLIYPLDAFKYKALTYLTNSLFYCIQLILIYSLTMIFYNNEAVNITNLLTGTFVFLLAAITFMYLSMCVELVSLWADNIWTLMVLLRFVLSFLGGAMVPLSFFPDLALSALRFTPFPYFIALPTEIILGRQNISDSITGVCMLILWAIIFKGVLSLIWKRGSKQYSGVGI